MRSAFVNPYSFVPAGSGEGASGRAKPTFHDGRTGGTYSGSVDVSWALHGPLLLPATAEEEGWISKGKTVRIPGSSIAGAVRSVHETMFRGCYRIVDLDYMPSYREAAKTDDDLRLAVVVTSKDGKPTRVQLCEGEAVWVDSGDLLRAWPPRQRKPTSGDVVDIRGTVRRGGLDRLEFEQLSWVKAVHVTDQHQAPGPEAVGKRVILVTSTSARKPMRRGGEGRAFWATGKALL